MESLWLAALVTVISAVARSPLELPFATLFGLQASTAVVTRLLQRIPALAARRWLVLAAGALGLVVWLHLVIAPEAGWGLEAWASTIARPWLVRPAVTEPFLTFAWLVGGYLTCRGLLIGFTPASAARISRWFVSGMIALTVLCAAVSGAAAPTDQIPIGELRSLVVGYFLVGLATTALGHRPTQPIAPAWVLAIGVPIVLVVAVGALLGSGIDGLRWLPPLIVDLARGSIGAVVWLLNGALIVVRWIGSIVPSCSPGGPAASPHPGPLHPAAPPGSHAPHDHPVAAPPEIDIVPGLVVALIIVAAYVVIRVLRRGRANEPAPTVDDDSTSVWSWRALFARVRRAVGGLAARLAARGAGSSTDREIAGAGSAVDDMRRVYRDLLAWAARRGHRRAPSTTALEFARQLAGSGTAAAAVDAVTAAYVEARYGELAVTDDDVARARRIVDELTRDP